MTAHDVLAEIAETGDFYGTLEKHGYDLIPLSYGVDISCYLHPTMDAIAHSPHPDTDDPTYAMAADAKPEQAAMDVRNILENN